LTPIRIPAHFRKKLRKKPPEMRSKVLEAVSRLQDDPRHPGLRTHRVWGTPGVFEARLDQGNRLTFHWDGPTLVLRTHCSHDVLKNP
jgi:mRNA interferase RelE/StbE